MTEIFHRDLRFGNKTMSVDINGEAGTASVRFGTRIPGEKYRKPGETTGVYLLAEAVISQWVQIHNREVRLKFDTANSNLKKWSRHHLNDLGFEVEPENPDSWRVTVEKTFSPSGK